MRAPSAILVPILAVALGAGACVDPGPARLRITDIEVTGEIDFGNLEVEVHLFDAVDHTFLGCSGQDNGLEQVDASDVPYAVSAYVRAPDLDRELGPVDLEGRAIEIQVIEDDTDRCPARPGPDDDVIGIATGFDLLSGQTVAFDDVTRLRIAVE